MLFRRLSPGTWGAIGYCCAGPGLPECCALDALSPPPLAPTLLSLGSLLSEAENNERLRVSH